jgi:hypothetical protein
MANNGKLGKALSQANQWVTLYTVPATGVVFATVNISVVNKDGSIANSDIVITNASNPANILPEDYIGYQDELLAGGGSVEYLCQLMSPGESVMVRVSNAVSAIRVSGLEKAA